MLRITTETKRTKTVLTIEGRIAGPSVATVEQCWRELYAASPRQKFTVNLCGVSFIDNSGKMLLREMHRLGAEFQAEGCLNQAIVGEISTTDATSASSKTKRPKGSPIIFYIVFLQPARDAGVRARPGTKRRRFGGYALPRSGSPSNKLLLWRSSRIPRNRSG